MAIRYSHRRVWKCWLSTPLANLSIRSSTYIRKRRSLASKSHNQDGLQGMVLRSIARVLTKWLTNEKAMLKYLCWSAHEVEEYLTVFHVKPVIFRLENWWEAEDSLADYHLQRVAWHQYPTLSLWRFGPLPCLILSLGLKPCAPSNTCYQYIYFFVLFCFIWQNN